MKKLLQIFFLSLFVTLSVVEGHAQTNVYHPFPDSNAIWRVNYWVLCSNQTISQSYYQYTMDGDTTIGSYTYTKIYKSGMFTGCPPPPFSDTLYTYNYSGALRQDIVNRKVYFRPSTFSCPDTLIYDFSKQVGDTLNYLICATSNTYTVSSIDSVLVGNNYHKQFHLYNGIPFLTNTLIEGIGATSGLLEPLYSGPHANYSLVCFSHDSDIYPVSAVSCPMITGITESSYVDIRVNIFPNPFSTQTTLQTNNNLQNATLIVYNSFGQEVKQIKNISGQSVILHRDNLPSGLYFIRLTQENKIFSTSKLIISDN